MSLSESREKPRTSAAWPRLSETLPHLHPQKCAHCGKAEHADAILHLWQECNEQDAPEVRYVLLCAPCGEQLIEPHVRLYHAIDRNSPAPGAMELCADCRFRDGLWCARAKANGGPGMTIMAARGLNSFGRPFTTYPMTPSACSGKERRSP